MIEGSGCGDHEVRGAVPALVVRGEHVAIERGDTRLGAEHLTPRGVSGVERLGKAHEDQVVGAVEGGVELFEDDAALDLDIRRIEAGLRHDLGQQLGRHVG